MAYSKHNRRNGDWSMVGDDGFGEIAMRMDATSAFRLAICSKELHRQVMEAKGSRCPNDGCGTLVSYHDFHDHNIACPHGPCNCTEPGCEFVAPPAAHIAHLREAHSMRVRRLRYCRSYRYADRPVLSVGSRKLDIIGSGVDGTVFAVLFHTAEKNLDIYVVCVRPAACLSPRYNLKLRSWWNDRRPRSVCKGRYVLESTASPAGIPLGDLKVRMQVRLPPSRCTLTYSLRIDRIHE